MLIKTKEKYKLSLFFPVFHSLYLISVFDMSTKTIRSKENFGADDIIYYLQARITS